MNSLIRHILQRPRLVFLGIFLVCAGLIGFGLVLQHVKGLEPCPMCIMQRFAFVACGLVALTAAIHGPGPVATRIYAGLTLLATLAGGTVAARQTWIQHFPPAVADCGPDLEFMLDSFPLVEALPMIFKGSGDCAKVQWTFLGFSIPEWALVWFALFLATSLYLMLQQTPRPA